VIVCRLSSSLREIMTRRYQVNAGDGKARLEGNVYGIEVVDVF